MFQKPSLDSSSARNFSDNYAPNTNSDAVETVVGPSVNVEGDFSSEGNILVKGTVSGNVKTSRLLTVEKGARILANIKAGQALISGEIKGNMKVDDKLELTSTARIVGDIHCGVLVIEAGALVQGKVTMDGIDPDFAKAEKKKGFLRTRQKDENIDTSSVENDEEII